MAWNYKFKDTETGTRILEAEGFQLENRENNSDWTFVVPSFHGKNYTYKNGEPAHVACLYKNGFLMSDNTGDQAVEIYQNRIKSVLNLPESNSPKNSEEIFAVCPRSQI